MANNFNEQLANALMRVGTLEGVTSTHDGDDDITIKAGYLNDYFAMTYLSDLLSKGYMEIKITPSRIEPLFRMLHIENKESED